MLIQNLALLAVLAPLIGSIIAGVFRNVVGVKGATIVTIVGISIALLCSLILADQLLFAGAAPYNHNLYTWAATGEQVFHVGFLIDQLTVVMMVVVTFVSLLVHIYSIGYMKGDGGYPRFFAYMSLFTFAMLMLVTSDNFIQLFFGWVAREYMMNYQEIPRIHPEMFDSNGNILPDEIVAFRFENNYDDNDDDE